MVLVIAGLIFIVAFVGLPAMQLTQRDTQRRRDVDRIFSAIVEYQKNNKLQIPCKGLESGANSCNYDQEFVPRYIDPSCKFDKTEVVYKYKECGDQFIDPDGENYNIYPTGILPKPKVSYNAKTSNQKSDTIKLSSATYADTDFTHTIYLGFGYTCGTQENTMYPTGKSNDYLVAKELENGSWYCRSSAAAVEDASSTARPIKPSNSQILIQEN